MVSKLPIICKQTVDAEAAWEAKLAAGNAIIADANVAAGKKVHESVRRSAAKL